MHIYKHNNIVLTLQQQKPVLITIEYPEYTEVFVQFFKVNELIQNDYVFQYKSSIQIHFFTEPQLPRTIIRIIWCKTDDVPSAPYIQYNISRKNDDAVVDTTTTLTNNKRELYKEGIQKCKIRKRKLLNAVKEYLNLINDIKDKKAHAYFFFKVPGKKKFQYINTSLLYYVSGVFKNVTLEDTLSAIMVVKRKKMSKRNLEQDLKNITCQFVAGFEERTKELVEALRVKHGFETNKEVTNYLRNGKGFRMRLNSFYYVNQIKIDISLNKTVQYISDFKNMTLSYEKMKEVTYQYDYLCKKIYNNHS